MKTGWVIQDKFNETYLHTMDAVFCQAVRLDDAFVFGSRADARVFKAADETVHKVSLTKNGTPDMVIGRG